jgi:DNA-binding PadR family transcriptional regulator
VQILRREVEPSIQERSLRAVLDLVILRLLTHHPMTGYEMNTSIVKKFGVVVSPNAIYSKISLLERRNLVVCIRCQRGRTYALTEQGKEVVASMPDINNDTQKMVHVFLKR